MLCAHALAHVHVHVVPLGGAHMCMCMCTRPCGGMHIVCATVCGAGKCVMEGLHTHAHMCMHVLVWRRHRRYAEVVTARSQPRICSLCTARTSRRRIRGRRIREGLQGREPEPTCRVQGTGRREPEPTCRVQGTGRREPEPTAPPPDARSTA